MRAVASEVAHVLHAEEDGDFVLFTLGVDEDGEMRLGREATGTLEEVAEKALDDVPVVLLGRRLF